MFLCTQNNTGINSYAAGNEYIRFKQISDELIQLELLNCFVIDA